MDPSLDPDSNPRNPCFTMYRGVGPFSSVYGGCFQHESFLLLRGIWRRMHQDSRFGSIAMPVVEATDVGFLPPQVGLWVAHVRCSRLQAPGFIIGSPSTPFFGFWLFFALVNPK